MWRGGRRGLHAGNRFWHGKACRKRFNVTAGMPMHRTDLPLLTWAQAVYLIVFSSGGVWAMKLAGMLGVYDVTAWHPGHRIRAMMAEAVPFLSASRSTRWTREHHLGSGRSRSAITTAAGRPSEPDGRGTKRPLVRVTAERGGVCGDLTYPEPRPRWRSSLPGGLRHTGSSEWASGPRLYRVGSTASSRIVEEP